MTAIAYLLLAVAISTVGCTAAYLFHRTPPQSVESGIATFKHTMDLLATRELPPRAPARRTSAVLGRENRS